jgi:hypothetical protein
MRFELSYQMLLGVPEVSVSHGSPMLEDDEAFFVFSTPFSESSSRELWGEGRIPVPQKPTGNSIHTSQAVFAPFHRVALLMQPDMLQVL